MHAITSEGGRSQFLVKLVRYIAQETKDEEFAGGIEFARAYPFEHNSNIQIIIKLLIHYYGILMTTDVLNLF